MFKLIVVGIWACIVAIGAELFVQRLTAPASTSAQNAAQKGAPTIEARKTPELNVPKIKNGALTGYVVAKFAYDIDLSELKAAKLSPDPIVVDEALRFLFSDDSTDFSHLKPIDISGMTEKIKTDVNSRVGANVIVDVMIDELNLLAKDQGEKPL